MKLYIVLRFVLYVVLYEVYCLAHAMPRFHTVQQWRRDKFVLTLNTKFSIKYYGLNIHSVFNRSDLKKKW